MPGHITPLARQKMEAAKAARKEELARTTVRVAGWIVYRLDEANVVLEKAGDPDRRAYYPTWRDAFSALLDRRIEDRAANTLESFVRAVGEAKGEVLAAVRQAGAA